MNPRNKLITEAEYLAAEFASGDAVPVAVLVKARPFIDVLATATVAAKSDKATDDDDRKLQLAMIDVMAAIAPVTLSSLHETDCSGKPRRGWFSRTRPSAVPGEPDEPIGDVELFSDRLVLAALAFLALATVCTLVIAVMNDHLREAAEALAKAGVKVCDQAAKMLNNTTSLTIAWREALNVIQPVLFGGLGACVYLLRSLHNHIHERTFDPRYKPEYLNRAVLGMVSGGVVTLLAQQIKLIPELAEISGAALAFIIGYNTDLLFSLIERISNALFPKVPDPPAAVVVPPVQPQSTVTAPTTNTQADSKKAGEGETTADDPKP